MYMNACSPALQSREGDSAHHSRVDEYDEFPVPAWALPFRVGVRRLEAQLRACEPRREQLHHHRNRRSFVPPLRATTAVTAVAANVQVSSWRTEGQLRARQRRVRVGRRVSLRIDAGARRQRLTLPLVQLDLAPAQSTRRLLD